MLVAPAGSADPAFTLMLKEQDELPQLFDASQVTTVRPDGNVLPEAGVHVTTGDVPEDVGSVKNTVSSHELISAGHAPMTGLALTVTLNEQVPGDPQPLLAVHVTAVVPTLNVEPDDGEHVTVAAGSPVAVGSVQDTTALSHCAISAGHAPITGAEHVVVTDITFEFADVLAPPVALTR